MSNVETILQALERIEGQNTWLVQAVKHLLANEAGFQPDTPLDQYDDDVDEDAELAAQLDAIQDEPPACTHQHQALVQGKIRCAQCGFVIGSSGLVGTDERATIKPGQEPEWARAAMEGGSDQ